MAIRFFLLCHKNKLDMDQEAININEQIGLFRVGMGIVFWFDFLPNFLSWLLLLKDLWSDRFLKNASERNFNWCPLHGVLKTLSSSLGRISLQTKMVPWLLIFLLNIRFWTFYSVLKLLKIFFLLITVIISM